MGLGGSDGNDAPQQVEPREQGGEQAGEHSGQASTSQQGSSANNTGAGEGSTETGRNEKKKDGEDSELD